MRILVCGSVNGKLNAFFNKIMKIMASTGAFDSVFCVGDFLGEDMSEFESYRDGRSMCPVPTFFIGPTDSNLSTFYPDANGASICTNLIYLGHRGVLTTEDGLRVVYLSGLELKDEAPSVLHSTDIDMLDRDLIKTGQREGVDILLTSAVPLGIETLQNKKDCQPFEDRLLSPLISKLAVHLKPRYHFCNGRDTYFEAPPYRNYRVAQQKEMHVTRFIALANSLALKDQKGMYGFQITAMSNLSTSNLLVGSPQAIESPYTFVSLNQNHALLPTLSNNFFFEPQNPIQVPQVRSSNRAQQMNVSKRSGSYTDRSTNCDVINAPCWFCPGEVHYEKHLVISVGDEVYLSLARGGLTDNHLMIVPIEHIRSTRDCSSSVLEEINKYKSALVSYFDKEYNSVPVFFERFLKTVHFQIQCIAVPKSKSDIIELVFKEYLDHMSLKYEFVDVNKHMATLVEENVPFFLADLPNQRRLFVKLSEGGLHLQFGRIVLASKRLLNITNRGFNWKLCLRSESDEADIVRKLRRSFAPYDPVNTVKTSTT